jgi:hypothetical protein
MSIYDAKWEDIVRIHTGYKIWDSTLRSISWVGRGANMPEALSEAIVCKCVGAQLIRTGHGDILLPNGNIGEVKATSKSEGNDLSSFSPSSGFDHLYFVQPDADNIDSYLVFDLNMNRTQMEKVFVTQSQTFGEQASAGRRPRLSIKAQIIEARGLLPTWRVHVLNHKVEPLG